MNKNEFRLLANARQLLIKAINQSVETDEAQELEVMLRRGLRELDALLKIQTDRSQRRMARLTTKINGAKLELKGHPQNEPKFTSFMAQLKGVAQ